MLEVPFGAAALSSREIEGLIRGNNLVTPRPLVTAADGAIDLHLSDLFLVGKRSVLPSISMEEPRKAARLFNEMRIARGHRIALQPQQFFLASTLEYLALPDTVCGLIQSRSTAGRMGVISVAAAWVAPGYKGSPTLEVFNAGDISVELAPFGEPVCQVILFSATRTSARISRYQCSTKARFATDLGDELIESWLRYLSA